jgi:DNA-directed RNA polymerase subunit F
MADEPVAEEGRMVSLADVKMMLIQAQQEREELTYEQKLALEHSLRFARVDPESARAIIADLRKEIPEITETYAFKVADLCPVERDDVKALFAKSRITIGEDQVDKVIEIVLRHHTPDTE